MLHSFFKTFQIHFFDTLALWRCTVQKHQTRIRHFWLKSFCSENVKNNSRQTSDVLFTVWTFLLDVCVFVSSVAWCKELHRFLFSLHCLALHIVLYRVLDFSIFFFVVVVNTLLIRETWADLFKQKSTKVRKPVNCSSFYVYVYLLEVPLFKTHRKRQQWLAIMCWWWSINGAQG